MNIVFYLLFLFKIFRFSHLEIGYMNIDSTQKEMNETTGKSETDCLNLLNDYIVRHVKQHYTLKEGLDLFAFNDMEGVLLCFEIPSNFFNVFRLKFLEEIKKNETVGRNYRLLNFDSKIEEFGSTDILDIIPGFLNSTLIKTAVQDKTIGNLENDKISFGCKENTLFYDCNSTPKDRQIFLESLEKSTSPYILSSYDSLIPETNLIQIGKVFKDHFLANRKKPQLRKIELLRSFDKKKQNLIRNHILNVDFTPKDECARSILNLSYSSLKKCIEEYKKTNDKNKQSLESETAFNKEKKDPKFEKIKLFEIFEEHEWDILSKKFEKDEKFAYILFFLNNNSLKEITRTIYYMNLLKDMEKERVLVYNVKYFSALGFKYFNFQLYEEDIREFLPNKIKQLKVSSEKRIRQHDFQSLSSESTNETGYLSKPTNYLIDSFYGISNLIFGSFPKNESTHKETLCLLMPVCDSGALKFYLILNNVDDSYICNINFRVEKGGKKKNLMNIFYDYQEKHESSLKNTNDILKLGTGVYNNILRIVSSNSILEVHNSAKNFLFSKNIKADMVKVNEIEYKSSHKLVFEKLVANMASLKHDKGLKITEFLYNQDYGIYKPSDIKNFYKDRAKKLNNIDIEKILDVSRSEIYFELKYRNELIFRYEDVNIDSFCYLRYTTVLKFNIEEFISILKNNFYLFLVAHFNDIEKNFMKYKLYFNETRRRESYLKNYKEVSENIFVTIMVGLTSNTTNLSLKDIIKEFINKIIGDLHKKSDEYNVTYTGYRSRAIDVELRDVIEDLIGRFYQRMDEFFYYNALPKLFEIEVFIYNRDGEVIKTIIENIGEMFTHDFFVNIGS